LAVHHLPARIRAFVLRRALAGLSEDYREPLLLQVLGGFSCDEIADTLGISASAVMTRLFRARKQMRDLIGDDARQVKGVAT
jgi:RNA polymerase sigma-70 factor (ECF subfamily)